MRSLRHSIAIAFAVGSALSASPQVGRAAPAPSLKLRGQHTSTADVRAITVTRHRVWAATEGGLAVHRRSDGHHLCTLTSGDGLPGNSLRVVATLGRGRLLVGGDFGAVILQNAGTACGGELRVTPVEGTEGVEPFDPVFGFAHVAGRSVLLRHQTGVATLRKIDGPRPRVGAGNSRIGLWRALAATDKRVVMGGLDGTMLFYPARGRARGPSGSLTLELPVLAMAAQGQHLVVATGESLLRVEGDRLRPLQLRIQEQEPRALAATTLAAGSRFLVGDVTGAVYRLDDDVLTLIAEGLEGRVTALAEDGERLWVGVGERGLHRVELGTPATARALRPRGEICSNHITKLTRHRGKLVAGSFDQGACVLEDWGWRALPGLGSPMVHGVASDGLDLYVATSSGISRFDRRLVPKKIGRRDALALRWLSRTSATGAVEIGPRQVALSSAHGLVRVWRKRNGRTRTRFTNHEEGVPFAVTALSAHGREVFIGSEKEGVKAMGYGHAPARRYQDPVDLPENWVMHLDAVSQDELWVATCQRGVAHLRGDAHTWIGKHNGLVDDRVIAVSADRAGAFVATLGGLSWVSSDHQTARGFGLAVGMPDPRGAALYRDGDELWVGTEAGLARFEVGRAGEVVVATRAR